MFTSRKIRVLIVDDSAVVRRYASEALASDPEIEVVERLKIPMWLAIGCWSLSPMCLPSTWRCRAWTASHS